MNQLYHKEIFFYKGKPLKELTTEELIEALKEAAKQAKVSHDNLIQALGSLVGNH